MTSHLQLPAWELPYGETLIERQSTDASAWLIWRARIRDDGTISPGNWSLIAVMNDAGLARDMAMDEYEKDRTHDVCVQEWIIGTTIAKDDLWWASNGPERDNRWRNRAGVISR